MTEMHTYVVIGHVEDTASPQQIILSREIKIAAADKLVKPEDVFKLLVRHDSGDTPEIDAVYGPYSTPS
jgi:hypothetical protein